MANRGWDWQKQDEEAAAVDQTEREGGADLITAGALAGKEHGTSFKCGRRGRRGCGLRPARRVARRCVGKPMQARLHLHLLPFNSSALPELLMSVNEIAMRRV